MRTDAANGESKMPPETIKTSATPVEPVLIARGVSKFSPGVVALDNVDFEIRPGEVNALLGENGAGKSTLIKIMSGFYAPDRGEILINGKHLSADPAAAHKAGVATIQSGSSSGSEHDSGGEHHAWSLAVGAIWHHQKKRTDTTRS